MPVERKIEAEVLPAITQRQRRALEEDPLNKYEIFDMLSGQNTTGRIEALSPTPRPAAKPIHDTERVQTDLLRSVEEDAEYALPELPLPPSRPDEPRVSARYPASMTTLAL
jgi:hypothetical protein